MSKRDYVLLVPLLGMVAAYYYNKRFNCVTQNIEVFVAFVSIQVITVTAVGWLLGYLTS